MAEWLNSPGVVSFGASGSLFTKGELCDRCTAPAEEVGWDQAEGAFARCDEHWLGYDGGAGAEAVRRAEQDG